MFKKPQSCTFPVFQDLCERAVGCFCAKAWKGHLFANEQAMKEVGVSKIGYL